MENIYSLPSVSIIVPVYNSEKTVAACIESLLAQTYPTDKTEIIFVDNKSSDKTLSLMQPYADSGKIRVLSETKILNAYGARNTGVKAAKGEILAFTDADCEAKADWLEYLIMPFEEQDIGCVSGEILPAKPQNVIEKYWDEGYLSQKRFADKEYPRVLGGNCAFRHQIFDVVGFFREDFPSGGDTELANRMREKSTFRIKLALDAIVRHHNVSTLRIFIKQSIRHGTHVSSFISQPNQSKREKPSFTKSIINTIKFLGVFLKRIATIAFCSFSKPVPKYDLDIYIARPLLRIIQIWATWWGYRFALKRPKIMR